MKQQLKTKLEAFYRYNSDNIAFQVFGLSKELEYDALIVAPSFTPERLGLDETCKITCLREAAYTTGYLVEKDDLKIAWIKTASGASNLIDHVAVCAELKFKKMIFIGAVGALKENYELGDICTPSVCITSTFANTFLKKSLQDFVPFEKVLPDLNYTDSVVAMLRHNHLELKKASVFCTDSIAFEYTHLNEIKSYQTDLIEMETSSFYTMAELLEIPSIALLVVSDNSASGVSLIGRTQEQSEKYHNIRKTILPQMIFKIIEME